MNLSMLSSPKYAQSNGKAENSVKIVKTTYSQVHNGRESSVSCTPRSTQYAYSMIKNSPAQPIFGRRTKTLLPAAEHLLRLRYADVIKETLYERKERQTY